MRGCGPRDARSTRARGPKGAVWVTATGRSPEPQMPVRIGPAPPPMDPRGMHSGTTQAKRRRRPTKPPRSGCSGGPIRSGCWFVEPTVRVQIAARACGSVAEEPMRSPAERVDAGASPARSIVPQWLTQWERPPRKREDAGASPACGLGRVGQPETEPIPSKGRSAVESRRVLHAPVVYRTGRWPAKPQEAVQFRSGASGMWCNLDSIGRFERLGSGFESSRARSSRLHFVIDAEICK